MLSSRVTCSRLKKPTALFAYSAVPATMPTSISSVAERAAIAQWEGRRSMAQPSTNSNAKR